LSAVRQALRFHLRHALLPTLTTLALLYLIAQSGLDWRITDLFYDAGARVFPLREDPILEFGLHRAVKYAVVLLACGILAAAMLSLFSSRLAAWRRTLWFVVAAMALSSASVVALKAATGKHCPYDLELYGGDAPYVGLFEPLPPDVSPGRCWPGGHASTGFSLFPLYFAANWLGRRRTAVWLLGAALALGFGLGLARVAQGAHFVSHIIWSALVCWLITLALFEVLLRRHAGPQMP
jgi:membrane-associated PAP2 superfamily phosphatase